MATTVAAVAGLGALAASIASAALPPVPVPAGNPLTEPKRVLGKILFWDEQLSSDNTVACGTCHRPGQGGGDPRIGVNPGKDGQFGTDDDTVGSPGEAHMNARGMTAKHAAFGFKPQIGDRTAPSNFGGLWAGSLFWDGRAGPRFDDPETGRTLIASGGALENQALGPLQNPAEMARDKRGWDDLERKLRQARPLALASRIPADMAGAVAAHPDYPSLFQAAFGDGRITAARVAMAMASYERTLVPDQTPYDLGTRPGQPVDPEIQHGMLLLDTAHCTVCHKPPLFTDNLFHNIGVRRPYEDLGRGRLSGAEADQGAFKTPTLRNAGLRASFMHTGEFHSLRKVLDHYVTPKAEAAPLPGTNQPYRVSIEDSVREDMVDFLTKDLTDPRVQAETFPFDRPVLRSERAAGEPAAPPAPPKDFKAKFAAPGVVELTWAPPPGGAADYRLVRDGTVIGMPVGDRFRDEGQSPWLRHSYSLVARNDAATASSAVGAGAGFPTVQLAGGGALLVGAGAVYGVLRRRRRG